MQNKGIEVSIITVTILTTIVGIVGFSFAYFTAQAESEQANVDFTTAKIGSLTFNAGNNISADMNYDDTESKTFSLIVGPSDVEQHVVVNIEYSNNFPGIQYSTTMTGVSVDNVNVTTELNNIVTNDFNNGIFSDNAVSSVLPIMIINIKPNSKTVVLNYRLDISLNADGGGNGTFSGRLYGALDNSRKYYYNNFTSGTSMPS